MSTERATSFGSAAAAYERGRPGYPTEAVDFVLPSGARRVLDLGAGTGKLTRQLVTRGLDVVAVEPLQEMRAELTRVLPEVGVLAGTAEAVPLPRRLRRRRSRCPGMALGRPGTGVAGGGPGARTRRAAGPAVEPPAGA